MRNELWSTGPGTVRTSPCRLTGTGSGEFSAASTLHGLAFVIVQGAGGVGSCKHTNQSTLAAISSSPIMPRSCNSALPQHTFPPYWYCLYWPRWSALGWERQPSRKPTRGRVSLCGDKDSLGTTSTKTQRCPLNVEQIYPNMSRKPDLVTLSPRGCFVSSFFFFFFFF